MTSDSDLVVTDHVNEAGKNKCQLFCARCGCKVLPPDTGTYEKMDYDLPTPTSKVRIQ